MSYKELYSNSNFTLLNASSNSSNNGWFQQQLPSAMLNYSYIDNYNYDIKNNTEIITIYNDKVYSILFSADEPRYEEDLLDARQMIESLKIFSLIPYENIDEGVRMEYPSHWKNVTEFYSDTMPIFVLTPPVESQSRDYRTTTPKA